MKQKLTYMGAGMGIVLFAIFGLLPGSFLGGVAGLSISGALLGSPVDPGVLQRMITALSMLAGVLLSGLLFISTGATLGWLIGTTLDTAARTGKQAGPEHNPTKA